MTTACRSIAIDAKRGFIAHRYTNQAGSVYYGVPVSLIQAAHEKNSQYMNSWMLARRRFLDREYGITGENAFPKVVLEQFRNRHARRVIPIDYLPLLTGVLMDFTREGMFNAVLAKIDETLEGDEKLLIRRRVVRMIRVTSRNGSARQRERQRLRKRPPVRVTIIQL